jgi:hypothetical protein
VEKKCLSEEQEGFGIPASGVGIRKSVSSGKAGGITIAGPSKGPDRNRKNSKRPALRIGEHHTEVFSMKRAHLLIV